MTSIAANIDVPGFGFSIPGSGATVIEYTHHDDASEGWRRNGIALVHRGGHEPFVVWRLIRDEDGRWYAESGDYYSNIADAAARYAVRAGARR